MIKIIKQRLLSITSDELGEETGLLARFYYVLVQKVAYPRAMHH